MAGVHRHRMQHRTAAARHRPWPSPLACCNTAMMTAAAYVHCRCRRRVARVAIRHEPTAIRQRCRRTRRCVAAAGGNSAASATQLLTHATFECTLLYFCLRNIIHPTSPCPASLCISLLWHLLTSPLQVLLFLKAHQLLSENNHQCIIALQPNGSPVLYTPSSAAGSAAAMPALVLERVQQLLLETPAAGTLAGNSEPWVWLPQCHRTYLWQGAPWIAKNAGGYSSASDQLKAVLLARCADSSLVCQKGLCGSSA